MAHSYHDDDSPTSHQLDHEGLIATNPDSSGPQVAYSRQPIAGHPEYSKLEVDRDGGGRYSEKEPIAGAGSDERRIFGLRFRTLWILVTLAIIVLSISLSVGLGVGLSERSSEAQEDTK